MAANGYSVTVTAIDHASKQIEAINKRIAAVNAPVERMQRQLGKLADSTGMSEVSRGMRHLAERSLDAFRNVGRLAPALGAITGVASVAGMERLAAAWADFGQRLGFSAQRIGVSVEQLQQLQGAARLAGASAESLTSGMQSLRDGLINAAAGRAPEVMNLLRTLGITLTDSQGRIRDVTAVLPELADKIAAIHDPTRQAIVATGLLGGAAEDLLPFLRRGSAGIQDLADQAQHYGVLTAESAERARDFNQSIARLELSAQGAANAIGGNLAPAFQPVLDATSEWIADHRALIATDVKGWASDYVAVLTPVAKAVDSVVNSTVGWNRALEIGIPAAVAATAGPLRQLEVRLAALVAFRVPAWILGLLGATGSGAVAGLTTFFRPNTSIQSDDAETKALRDAIDRMNVERARSGLAPLPVPGTMRSGAQTSEMMYPSTLPHIARGIRDNNPLNLKYAGGQPWAIGNDGGFGIYENQMSGVAAAQRQLLIYQQRDHLNTVRGIVGKWAPPGENDTSAYAAAVAQQMGVSLDAPLNLRDQAVASSLIAAMAQQETGQRLGMDTVRQGVALALGAPLALPGGATPSAAPNGTANLNIRVESAAGLRTTTRADITGDVFHGAPRIDTTMPGTGIP